MNIKSLATAICVSCFFSPQAIAQDEPARPPRGEQNEENPSSGPFGNDQAPDPARNPALWSATFATGELFVPLAKISSVAKQEYLIDTSLRVVEVTIDTQGTGLIRIYFIEPVSNQAPVAGKIAERGQQVVSDLSKRGGQDVDTTVIKSYPTTTHAKTIEFRVGTETAINQVYTSIRQSITSGRGNNITIR